MHCILYIASWSIIVFCTHMVDCAKDCLRPYVCNSHPIPWSALLQNANEDEVTFLTWRTLHILTPIKCSTVSLYWHRQKFKQRESSNICHWWLTGQKSWYSSKEYRESDWRSCTVLGHLTNKNEGSNRKDGSETGIDEVKDRMVERSVPQVDPGGGLDPEEGVPATGPSIWGCGSHWCHGGPKLISSEGKAYLQ